MNKLGYKSHKPNIYIGTDHAGFEMKEKLIPFIMDLGYEVHDCGAYELNEADDYPDFIEPVAKAVALNPESNRGIILGGSGQGEAMAANRFPNVRAMVFYGETGILKDDIIKLSRYHNDANIISLGARFIKLGQAKKAIKAWLGTHFSNQERHIRRIKKIEKISREVKNNFEFK
jgi:ribose 5-phosphate isomerase B